MEKLNNYLVRCHNINTNPPYYDFKVAVTKRYIKQYAKLMREKYDVVIIAKVDRTI
jgi:hypothetical protein